MRAVGEVLARKNNFLNNTCTKIVIQGFANIALEFMQYFAWEINKWIMTSSNIWWSFPGVAKKSQGFSGIIRVKKTFGHHLPPENKII